MGSNQFNMFKLSSFLVGPRFILSWQIRRFLRKMALQMPCGWPEYGIPPLAPLKLREGEVHFEKGPLK